MRRGQSLEQRIGASDPSAKDKEMLRFLTNTHDPKDIEGAKMSLALSFEDWQDPNGRERAWKYHLDYLKGKIIGDPQATDVYTVDQLKEMQLVGVYIEE